MIIFILLFFGVFIFSPVDASFLMMPATMNEEQTMYYLSLKQCDCSNPAESPSFAMVGEKNHRHSANNPYSQFRKVYTLDQILNSPKVYEPLTKLQCCPTSDGAGAVILASEAFVRKHGLEHQAVEIVGMSMATDMQSTFAESCIKVRGCAMVLVHSALTSGIRWLVRI